MTAAVLYGASSGVVHAVTGPDHVLSLGPVALQHCRTGFRIGALWGLGHAAGTLALALPLLLLTHAVALEALAGFGDRLAGAALLATAGWSWWSSRKPHAARAAQPRGPVAVGLVHGITGVGALVLLLPALVAKDAFAMAVFFVAFGVGSTLAMGLLTAGIARLGRALQPHSVARGQRALMACAALLGTHWLLVG
jgi:nickel/cobalt transporter (NicO) family protein